MRYAGSQPNAPPFVTRFFDVVLRNHAAAPRWFLLPYSITEKPAPGGGVSGVEAFDLTGRGRVLLLRFLGTAAFQAVRLPAGALVRLSRLAVKSWEDPPPPETIEFQVRIATALSVAGQSLGEGAPASDAIADVDAEHGTRITGPLVFSRTDLSGRRVDASVERVESPRVSIGSR